ncbi:hypothetical protein PV11_02653 [Exophiala sideris]|uniref:Cyclin-domain-containing protein n=1 Tax=Exophiala sideris TaxID=1016849 RepID=A0A0D1ZJY6_9EURO|nr:hypothetical protein PV11_02653 [Exophiala sideris]
MLATSPSPSISARHFESATSHYPQQRPQYDHSPKPASQPRDNPARRSNLSPDIPYKPPRNPSSRSLDSYKSSSSAPPKPKMVDAATQYSPPNQKVPSPPSSTPSSNIPTSTIAGLNLSEHKDVQSNTKAANDELKSRAAGLDRAAQQSPNIARSTDLVRPARAEGARVQSTQAKRSADEPAAITPPHEAEDGTELPPQALQSPVKKARPDTPPVRLMPMLYENCNTRDLVVLISSMLMELIRYNDAIPLREGQLTRFHSRAPPGISVLDYLQRLTTHATLSPPILLSVVYYIDRLCALYPAFTISSLTVHRFLITSATVASKGLSDSFWTNKTYARVGGVSMKELALLELEFLQRMDWRIVPKPEVLVDYYKSLIERNDQYQLEEE